MEAKHPRRHRSSRRELVIVGLAGAAGAAGAAIASSGGGGGHAARHAHQPRTPPPVATAAELDLVILNGLLRFERHSVAVYSLAVAELIGGTRETAAILLGHEREHAHAVERLIRDLGGTPAPPGDVDEWRTAQAVARGRGSTLATLRALEEQSVGAYLDALEGISVEDVRVTIAAVLAAESEHLAVVLGELGTEQLEAPSVTGTGGWERP